jgi:hypothetical protein
VMSLALLVAVGATAFSVWSEARLVDRPTPVTAQWDDDDPPTEVAAPRVHVQPGDGDV